jgi:hypothetical protein
MRRLADIQVPLALAGRTVLVMDPDPVGLVRSGYNMLSAVTAVTTAPRPGNTAGWAARASSRPRG